MPTIVIPDKPALTIRHEPLVPNIHREAILDFSSLWCRAYFQLSGDANHDLHSEEGAGIVQGMGILTLLGTTVSEHMPGYTLGVLGKAKFRNPVKIGNQVRMTMERLDGKGYATEVKATLEHMSGLPITEVIILLVRSKTP